MDEAWDEREGCALVVMLPMGYHRSTCIIFQIFFPLRRLRYDILYVRNLFYVRS